MTPGRSLNVHTEPSLLGDQLRASIGSSISLRLLSKVRNSPVWLSIARPPESATVSGLTAAEGAWVATFSVPPFLGVPAAGAAPVPVPVPDDVADVLLAPPHAATIAPSNGADIPITAPRRMKSRRLRLPEASSSM